MRRYSNIYQSHLRGCDNRKEIKNISNFCQSKISLYFYTPTTHWKQLLIFLVQNRLQYLDKAMKGFVHTQLIANQTVLLFTVTVYMRRSRNYMNELSYERIVRLDFIQWTKIGLNSIQINSLVTTWLKNIVRYPCRKDFYFQYKNWTSLCMVKVLLRIFENITLVIGNVIYWKNSMFTTQAIQHSWLKANLAYLAGFRFARLKILHHLRSQWWHLPWTLFNFFLINPNMIVRLQYTHIHRPFSNSMHHQIYSKDCFFIFYIHSWKLLITSQVVVSIPLLLV